MSFTSYKFMNGINVESEIFNLPSNKVAKSIKNCKIEIPSVRSAPVRVLGISTGLRWLFCYSKTTFNSRDS